MDMLMRHEFGGGPGRPPAPPKIPTAQDASRNLDAGNKKPRGYQSTILGTPKSAGAESNTPLKTLLGM